MTLLASWFPATQAQTPTQTPTETTATVANEANSETVETVPLTGQGHHRRTSSTGTGTGTHLTVVQVDLTPDEETDLVLDLGAGGPKEALTINSLDKLMTMETNDGEAGEAGAGLDSKPPEEFPLLMRHDSVFSVGSDYKATTEDRSVSGAPPLLNWWQGAVLLTADCLGTGLLALPHNIKVLGFVTGLFFLIVNAPINLYAGTILAHSATTVERRQKAANRVFASALRTVSSATASAGGAGAAGAGTYGATTTDTITSMVTIEESATGHMHHQLHHDTATFDFIGMTQALFRNPGATRLVLTLYYCNIFLVLGNYILVMSHAVMATVGEGILCTPVAGLIASVFMYAVSQSRTMSRLGRLASILSLAALTVVICQCLYAAQTMTPETAAAQQQQERWEQESSLGPTIHDVFRQLAALGSIGFAMGSQKLFLNIRHELQDRSKAPQTLALSLTIFTTVYTLIICLAGPDPPPFLFDAIRGVWNRRIAGFLLWGHVVVSYAINSQAICSSVDRLFWHRLSNIPGHDSPVIRWMILTAILAVTSYTVANAIPFFQDLVGLIGALTAVPLTLLLPALFWRKQLQVPVWRPTWDSVWSYALVGYSLLFMVTATTGVLDSILVDWKNHGGRPFACDK